MANVHKYFVDPQVTEIRIMESQLARVDLHKLSKIYVLGASWLIGALEALQDETGWDPSTADAIVGTSAGSVVGALTAAGLPPAYMSAYVAGHEVDVIAEAARRAGQAAVRVEQTLGLARVAG